MTNTAGSGSDRHRILLVFSGSGYAAEAMANVVSKLEAGGHQVELVSYGGLVAQTARSFASAAGRGLRAAMRTVTGKLSGEDPLGLGETAGARFDVVVVASPELMGATRGMVGDATLRVGLMSDLGWDPRWSASENDAVIVPHETFRQLTLRKGWSEASVKLAGVPLPSAFSQSLDVEGLRSRFGLDPAKGRILLIVAEGVDAERLRRLTFQLSLLDQPIQPIFYTGADTEASEALREAAGRYGVLARMFGEVDNLEEFYGVCELVLSEVSSPLIYPLLALDKPVVLFDADVDTRPVGAFLRDEGAAVLVPDLLRLGAELDAVLGDAALYARLQKGAQEVVDPGGAQRVAEAIVALASARADLIGKGRQRRDSGTANDEAVKKPLSGGGAFEVIGSASSAPSATPRSWSGGASGEPAPRDYDPPANPVTTSEAREQLAALILEERRVERKLTETSRFVSQWENRQDLARQAGEPDLAREAERFLEHYSREEKMLLREADSIRDQKDKLKRRVVRSGGGHSSGGAGVGGPPSAGQSSVLEGRFRDMEVDRDLSRLKSRLDQGDD